MVDKTHIILEALREYERELEWACGFEIATPSLHKRLADVKTIIEELSQYHPLRDAPV